ncbi:transmembrane channel-like protein 5 isoform X2 [Cynoglossus semilaevis]|uniref:transmembrane channel-like protein 5 isoform X2 n=1 Tax=Cynoglossus semilaevis TaxID=244447 RepID=UPI000D627796|nr:transmembrane channel-like protein 5 isoform X2 [Cynoglossus semilaevis]
MTSYSHGGFHNPAYHDSETLEIDRRYSRKTDHTNPYAREEVAWRGSNNRTVAEHGSMIQTVSGNDSPYGGWQEENRRGRENIPMGLISTQPGRTPWQNDLNRSTSYSNIDSQYNPSPPGPPPSSITGKSTIRWRGNTMRRMSMFPNTDPAYAAFTENAIKNEMENEEQNLVKELVPLSTRERIQAIQELPMSFEEKKHIRSQVLAFKSSNQSRQCTCFTDCSENVSLFFRRCGYAIRSTKQTLGLWQGTMKEIGGKFGTSVLSYFLFLKWLLMFNIFSFLVNFSFITIPVLVFEPSPNTPANVTFRGLELLTGAGYFRYTVMYYGGYSNETLHGLVDYDMQLSYFFTIAVYMALCVFVLVISATNSFKNNYTPEASASNGAWQLLCSWDFRVTNERAVRQRKNNLRVQLKESLSENSYSEQLTLSVRLKHFGIYLGFWLLSIGLAAGCGASIFFLCRYEEQRTTDSVSWTLAQEAETLVVPFVVSLMNLVVPLFYSLFNKFEHYSSQRRKVYALVLRNVFLRLSILGVLCYHWMNVVSKKYSCWETIVGQSLYRLVIFDFMFLLLGSFFGEFLRKVGIYFSPLLPAIQILKFFILFYLKKVSLTRNCQPPQRTGRAAQMQTAFICLLFFPFFVGSLSIVGYTAWSLTPSTQCGPFKGLNNTFSVVAVWMEELEEIPGADWVIWIYQRVIRSEVFYFLITIIIIIITYMFWQISQGRKELIGILKQQIVNEGKDKSFLLDKLQNLQKPNRSNKRHKQMNTEKHSKRPEDHSSGGPSKSNAMFQALLARQQLEEEEERRSTDGVPVPSDISSSSALTLAMMARQRAEGQEEHFTRVSDQHFSQSSGFAHVTQVTQRSGGQLTDGYYGAPEDLDHPTSSVSSIMMQVMQARQRAEEEDRRQWAPAHPQNQAPSGSSALIQAMLARQQAQNEFDDGY